MTTRRGLLAGGVALAAGAAAYGVLGARPSVNLARATGFPRLQMPPLLDTSESGRFDVTAQSGTTSFIGGTATPTIGFNQPYLGPVVRVQKGPLQPKVANALSWPVSSHWHGLLVPGEHDGGPHLPIGPGSNWTPDMQIDQPPCTAFFHTHIHGRTAQDVYAGLAGVIHIVDGHDAERGLPETYGTDDLTLVIQDRRFAGDGRLAYANSMMDIMHGMTGDTILVNGQIGTAAHVPKGIVRLRIVNASNARIYSLRLSDSRPMHLIATDGGYLTRPIALETLRMGPGERAEILVDFTSGHDVSLVSDGDPNQGMGGMIGRARGMLDGLTGARRFEVLPILVDERLPVAVDKIPDTIGGKAPSLADFEIAKTRRFSLDMGMGGGMMGGGMMGGFAINGDPFEMAVVNQRVRLGDTEKWVVSATMLAHPFHVHGVSFQVVRENGRDPLPESSGWKDTVVIDGETELLMRFTQPAGDRTPFMYHCHILEHEDGGMMGQFTVA